MTSTFLSLYFGHLIADFVLQTEWMVQGKRRIGPMATHIIIVFATTTVALGGGLMVAVIIALLHFAIDAIKLRMPENLASYAGDQVAHVVVLGLAAFIWPDTFSLGLWGGANTWLPPSDTVIRIMVLVSGAILAVRTGQYLIDYLMRPYTPDVQPGESPGLENGGAMIGVLERALTFMFVLAGHATGVGFLIAAKSFLRVVSIEKNRSLAEYVIIGTLASIGWALAIAYGTRFVLDSL